MISAEDVVRLECSPELIKAGISFCTRALPALRDDRGKAFFGRLRRIVAHVAVELAFRRYLGQLGIPFTAARPTRFTSIQPYDLSLGANRCNIITYLISDPDQVASLHVDRASALRAPALVAAERYWAGGRQAADAHLFALLAGYTSDPVDKGRSVSGAAQGTYLLHVLPTYWANPRPWIPMSPLALKSESDQALWLELGGQDEAAQPISCAVELRPRTRLEIDDGFYSLSHLHTRLRPTGAIGVGSPGKREMHLARPQDWGDIWIDGMDILLLGWMRHGEFRKRARVIPAGNRVFQFNRTRKTNLAVPVTDLKPLEQLLAGVPKSPEQG